MIIEPRIQNLLRSGNPPPIRAIEEAFPDVEIRWPHQAGSGEKKQRHGTSTANETSATTDYVLQLCGVRDQVDSAAEKINRLVKQITDENYEQEVGVFSLILCHFVLFTQMSITLFIVPNFQGVSTPYSGYNDCQSAERDADSHSLFPSL